MLALDPGEDAIFRIRAPVEAERVRTDDHVDRRLGGGGRLDNAEDIEKRHTFGRMRPLAPPRKIPQLAEEYRLDLIFSQAQSVSSG